MIQTNSSEPKGGDEAILVVEDNELVRTSVVKTLTRLGYFVVSAEDGYEAIDAMSTAGFKPDLLLTDIMLPGNMNGHEVSREVLHLQPDCNIVYMSGYSAGTLSNSQLLPEGCHRLAKPFSSAILASTIRKSLDSRTL
jgi:CheY-like chemotaxis protein